MSDEMKTGCGKVASEDLILAAYGECEDREIVGHVEECAECRAYLGEVRAVRETAAAGMVEIDRRVVDEVKAMAARENSPGWIGAMKNLFQGESLASRLAPAMVTALIFVMVVAAYLILKEDAVEKDVVVTDEVLEYLAEIEDDIDDIELAMAALEYDMGLASEQYSDSGDGESDQTDGWDWSDLEEDGSAEGWEIEDLDVPLLPGLVNGKSL